MLCLSSQVGLAQQPFVQSYQVNESHGPYSVQAIATDRNNYMYLGTQSGLFRFNGQLFKRMLSGNWKNVTALSLIDKEIWVGFENGAIGKIQEDSVWFPPFEGVVPETAITGILQGAAQTVWVTTEQGIFKTEGRKIGAFSRNINLSDNFVYTCQLLGKNRLIAGTDQGINLVSLNKTAPVEVISTAQGLADNIVRAIAPVAPGAATYWLGMQQGGVQLFDSKTGICTPGASSHDTTWQWGQVNDILPLAGHKAWIITSSGMLIAASVTPDREITYKEYKISEQSLQKVLMDKSGNIWVGTSSGLLLVTMNFLEYKALSSPYQLQDVSALAVDEKNRIWLALQHRLFVVEKEGNATRLLPVGDVPGIITRLFFDPDNRLWIGTSGSGLWVKEPNNVIVRQAPLPGLEQETILSISGTKKALWIAGLDGVKMLTYPDKQLSTLSVDKTYRKKNGVGSDYIYQLFVDSRQAVWMATDGAGVRKYYNDSITRWNSDALKAQYRVVYAITEDASGGIWAASRNRGLFRYDQGKWTGKGDAVRRQSDQELSALATTGNGQVVAVYGHSMQVWYPKSGAFRILDRMLDEKLDSTALVLNCTALDREGHLLLPIRGGLLLIKNGQEVYNIQPNVRISGVFVNSEKVLSGVQEFKPADNYLHFQFDGISFVNSGVLHYRYRLEGFSNNWVYTTVTDVSFPKLPPGHFKFVVEVSLNGDFSQAVAAMYDFRILKPVWQQRWFLILILVGLVLFAYVFIKYRERRINKLSQLKQERIQFEYDHLKDQVNPHFLFNSLNTLTHLIEEQKEEALTYTQRLSDLYRNILGYRNMDLVSVQEEWDILSNYLYIQRQRFGNALKITKNIPHDIMNEGKLPPMSLQMLVENAIKHNIVSRQQVLVVHIRYTQGYLIVQNTFQPKLKKDTGAGMGLYNISRRYLLLANAKIKYGIEGDAWIVRLPVL